MVNISLRTCLLPVFTLWCLIAGIVHAAALPAPVSDSDYHYSGQPGDAKFKLGQALFFDKILSGNRDTSCATCHHPFTSNGDGMSLPVGAGGKGLGVTRTPGSGETAIKARVGRNAPPLFNLGAKQFVALNWQGRMMADPNNLTKLTLPSGPATPTGLDNVLAGQALFPIQNTNEMIGANTAANEFPEAIFAAGNDTAQERQVAGWEAIMKRLRAISGYFTLFKAAYPELTSSSQMTISQMVNGLAAFQAVAFRADNSPFDNYLLGVTDALSPAEVRGMELFYGSANCASCHAGVFQTDHKFHAIAMPQFGPGFFSNGALSQEDLGRAEVDGTSAKYKFRTQPLRNVVFTAPYGHTGAYNTLEGVIRHHLDPVNSFLNWDRSQVVLKSRSDLDSKDFLLLSDSAKTQSIINANELAPSSLTDSQISDLLSFMEALTDPGSLDMRRWVPVSVPSGLPVAD
jgi:cytochrome c peroxidase